jgi:anti-sigma regulatory factor (Ser/Thr protein kinase)
MASFAFIIYVCNGMKKVREDIYKQRSNWKVILAVSGGIILLITLYYSNFLANSLMKNEQKNAKLYINALEYTLNDKKLNNDHQGYQDIIDNFALPAIMEYEDGSREAWNFNDDKVPIRDKDFIDKKIKEFYADGKQPLTGQNTAGKVYYFHSKLVTYIKYYPLVQILLIGSYIGLGYFLFNSSRRAEQNRVWAGMAKETAHQLGTPISAMLGWMSYLREISADSPAHLDVVNELEKDIDRLNLVADRFSKIGSLPELTSLPIRQVLDEVVEYMKRRSPRQVVFETSLSDDVVKVNDHLFQWVVENILRNALDALDGKGTIRISTYTDLQDVAIDITDTGKGIPSSKFKTVFQPGFSTKQRGWGLGLSLAKRIIEDYHSGKIFVKSSKINEGTTFTIKLPKVS